MKPTVTMPGADLYMGDCLSVLPTLPDGSVDLVLADPPYGKGLFRGDSAIPLGPLWGHLRRLVSPRGAVVMTAAQPFTSALVVSNLAWFKYCWVWSKGRTPNFAAARWMPLLTHEDVCVFSPAGANTPSRVHMTYNPQMTPMGRQEVRTVGGGGMAGAKGSKYRHLKDRSPFEVVRTHRHPRSILHVSSAFSAGRHHPAQKPVALMEYLIRTYSDGGDTVLDFCAGSGTTGLAALSLGRRYVGIEKEPDYHAIAVRRLAEAAGPLFANAPETVKIDSPPPDPQPTLFPL